MSNSEDKSYESQDNNVLNVVLLKGSELLTEWNEDFHSDCAQLASALDKVKQSVNSYLTDLIREYSEDAGANDSQNADFSDNEDKEDALDVMIKEISQNDEKAPIKPNSKNSNDTPMSNSKRQKKETGGIMHA